MPRLPELPAVALAGRYLPAASAQLGGDWYDAFQLPDGRLGHGHRRRGRPRLPRRRDHGPAAQRACERTRSTEWRRRLVLERLSRLLRQLEPGRTATVLYLVLDPHGRLDDRSSAGHPPPLRRARGRRADLHGAAGSAPLGATRHASYEEREHVARAWLRARPLHRRAGGARRASRSMPASNG